MDKFSRSKSSREGPGVQPSSMHDLRSHSTSDYNPQNLDYYSNSFNKDLAIKKGYNKSRISASSSSKNWNFNIDPELQRKKRIAGYKAYGVEGKLKNSFRRSFKWMKDVVHGLW